MGDRHGSLSDEVHAGYRTLTEHHRKKARNPFGLCSEKQCRSPTARCQGPKRGDFAPWGIPAPKCRFRFPGDPEMRTPDARGSITPASRCGPRDARSWKPATDGPSRRERRVRSHRPGRVSNDARPELKSRGRSTRARPKSDAVGEHDTCHLLGHGDAPISLDARAVHGIKRDQASRTDLQPLRGAVESIRNQ